MSKRLALKEWHPIIRAVCHDRAQTVLFRKGGILDSRFESKLDQNLTYFFPTSFHTDPGMLKPEWSSQVEERDIKSLQCVPIEYAFILRGAWHCTDPAVGEILDDFHVYGPTFLETRLRFKEHEPLCILEVEPYRLSKPLLLENRERLWGCFSWVDLGDIYPEKFPVSVTYEPILEDFAQRQQKLRESLKRVSGITPITMV